SSLSNPFSCCHPVPLCNTTGGCTSGQYWCPLLESCLPVTRPCSTYHSSTGGRVFPLPPRYSAVAPFYHIVADVSLKIPPASERVHFKQILVYPDDILAVQHSRQAGAFLHCVSGSDSGWRQSYLSLPGPEWGGWLEAGLTGAMDRGRWVDGVVCDLRLIYQDTMHLYGVSLVLNSTKSEFGMVTTTPATSLVNAQTPVSGMSVLHPKPGEDNLIHLPVNVPTLIIIKILSGYNATSAWSAPVSKTRIPFLLSCPPEMLKLQGACERDTPDTRFSYAYVTLYSQGEQTLNITASNKLNSQTLSVKLQAHILLTGLHIEPQGFHRVLVDIPQVQIYMWDFGDSSPCVNHTVSAPLERSNNLLDLTTTQMHLEDSAQHTYTNPGEYTLRIQAQNKYDHIEKAAQITVRSPLTRLLVSSLPTIPKVNQTVLFEASSLSSSYGILYTWNFGSGPLEITGAHNTIKHSFKAAGVYNVSVCANNGLSRLVAWMTIEVAETISGLFLSYNGPNELNSVTEISGTVSTGTGLRWTFELGDGSVFNDLPKSLISHIYRSEGNYTVCVTVTNAVSTATQSINVEIYKLSIQAILPFDCIASGKEITLQTLVTGNVSLLTFHWSFGDGTPLSVRRGTSKVAHTFSGSGNYLTNVVVYSQAGFTHYQSNVCVEALITDLSLHLAQNTVAVGEEICLNVSVLPTGGNGYQFLWYNSSSSDSPVHGKSHHCFVFSKEGMHEIMVLTHNQVSHKIANATIFVQQPVLKLSIQRQGTTDAFKVNESYYFWTEPSQNNGIIEWDFGDGTLRKEGQNQTHAFTSSGSFRVTASVSNAVSQESVYAYMEVQIPISSLVIHTNLHLVEAGQETVFTVVSNVMDNVHFYWTVDPLFPTRLGMSENRYVFPKAGVFEVKVTVENLVSKMENSTSIVVVERIRGVKITSQMLISMRYFPTKQTITFTAFVKYGSSLTFQWLAYQDGLNGTVGEGEHFKFLANNSGDVSVKLTVSNALGKVHSNISLRAVERISGVNISTPEYVVASGKPVKISVSAKTGTDLQYIWFLDSDRSPVTSDVPFVFHIFKATGIFNVKVSVANTLGSADATKQFRVLEDVSGTDFEVDGKTHPFFFTSNSFLQFHGFIKKGNVLYWEWTVAFPGRNVIILGNNQTVSYSFRDVGENCVTLNASNDISWQTVSHIITVQDAIQGLNLRVSEPIICENEPVTFTPSVSQGSGVLFILIFSSWNSSLSIQEVFTTASLPVGNHIVKAIAKNHVSFSFTSVTVQVMEKIKGLHLINCCSAALEASKSFIFKASVSTKSEVTYQWTFSLDGFNTSQKIGQNVLFSPSSNGSLSVTVEASTNFCSQSITKTATVQWPVKGVRLAGYPEGPFIDQLVTFLALTDSGSDLEFRWDFGDSDDAIKVAKSNRAIHRYIAEGRFVVQVTVFNNVSQISAQMPVVVRTLDCIQPQVTLIQEQSKIFGSRPNYFEAIVDLNGCASYKTTYLWEIFHDSNCIENKVPLDSLMDVTTPLLFLPRHTLVVGDYCVKFTTRFQGTPLRQHKTIKVSVIYSPLVPLIRGGSHRLWSSQNDLVLDGTESYDPDCGQQSTTVSHAPGSFHTDQPIQLNSSTLILPSYVLKLATVYQITLTVQKDGRSPVSTKQSVSAYKWTAENTRGEVLHLNEVTTTTGDSNPDLVIRPDVLRIGWEYVFSLNVSQPSTGLWGSAGIAVTPNLPPQRGNCTLSSEDSVQLLQNMVSFNCSGTAMLPCVVDFSFTNLHFFIVIRETGDNTSIITAVPAEYGDSHTNIVEAMRKMIRVIREQTRQGDVTPIDTGRNILKVLSKRSYDAHGKSTSEMVLSALKQAGELMRSLMWSRMPGEEPVSLRLPQIHAVGFRGDPTSNLLCTAHSRRCQFHVPPALSSQLRKERGEVLQILLVMQPRGNPFISAAEPPISTTLAAVEFATPEGLPIPIANLTSGTAIHVILHNQEAEFSPRVNISLPQKGSVNFTVKAVKTDPHAGLFIAFNFSLMQGNILRNYTFFTTVLFFSKPNKHIVYHCGNALVLLSNLRSFLHPNVNPSLNGSAKDLYVTLSSSVDGAQVLISTCVFGSLCQFFSMEQRRWSTEGLSVLSSSNPRAAHCLTRHLTLFGASLFVHPDAIVLLPPVGPSLMCGVLLLIHLLVGLIAHKLDHVESVRLSCVPLCGQPGRYRYRVLVKTGWQRGSGTSAHVGISLYGLNKSGSRHLRREGAFQRNGLDDFQVETDANLGEIWKICIWHDNTGLEPSWYLQHVIVWDMQMDNLFFFLVEDWLSVENENNSGMVRKVVLATCPLELQQFGRILRAQLHFGLREHHLWLSLWERPAHSTFSRAQRVTCSALLVHLYLAAGAVWYGSVGSRSSRYQPEPLPHDQKTVLVGMTVAVLMFPLQFILTFLFRMTKSKVWKFFCMCHLLVVSIYHKYTMMSNTVILIYVLYCWPYQGLVIMRTLVTVAAILSNVIPNAFLDSGATCGIDLFTFFPKVVQKILCACSIPDMAVVQWFSGSESAGSMLALLPTLESSEISALCPLQICVRAVYLAAVVKPVDPEVEERLAWDALVRSTEEDCRVEVHPPCGYGLLQAKEEARKLRKLHTLMRVSPHPQSGPLNTVLRPLRDTALTNFCSFLAICFQTILHNRVSHSNLCIRYLFSVFYRTRAVVVEFTQYHRQTGLLVPVSILLENSQSGRILSTISIQAFHIPSSSSGLDLSIALTVTAKTSYAGPWSSFGACPGYAQQGYMTEEPCFEKSYPGPHESRQYSFALIHSFTLCLVLVRCQMVGVLRFVRRWVVLSRMLRQACSEICGVVLGCVVFCSVLFLFSASVEGFSTWWRAGQSLLGLLRSGAVLHHLCQQHPALGPLYCLAVFGLAFWALGRLCKMLTYKMLQAEMYRPVMETQGYEMVEFLIKRLKMWMGLSKTKEFRHRVKFEGMEGPPSRSSQYSQLSILSVPSCPAGPRLLSSPSSLASETSILSDSQELQQHLDRLLPSVDSLLAGFSRINQLTNDVLNIELQLQKAQRRKKQKKPQLLTTPEPALTPKLPQPNQPNLRTGLKTLPSSHHDAPGVPWKTRNR
uniref:Polycystic kidney disease 1b n=1 Tax=Electrophorus electricus TaxID=8005 RepID=A0A4W4HSG0_ELEEL